MVLFSALCGTQCGNQRRSDPSSSVPSGNTGYESGDWDKEVSMSWRAPPLNDRFAHAGMRYERHYDCEGNT